MKKNILLAVCFLMPLATMAQNDTLGHERNITLSEAIVLARTQSVDAAVALNELKTAYWEYRTFRADLLPEVNFTGTLPNYNKSYSTYQNSDGSYSFVRNNTLGLSGQLSVDQNIWFTGGKLSLTSSLDYLKQLGSGGAKQFMSVPVSLELTQLMNNSPMQSMCGMWQSMTQRPLQRGMNFPTGAAGTGQGISLCMICRPMGMEVISYSLHYRDWGIRTRRHSAEPGTMWTAVT